MNEIKLKHQSAIKLAETWVTLINFNLERNTETRFLKITGESFIHLKGIRQ